MSERMEHAMMLADQCWEKAIDTAPNFVEQYFKICEQHLLSKPVVNGDEFSKVCRRKGLRRPKVLHHNVWVSGVRALEAVGWITKLGKVVPLEAHNHMPSVTQYSSNLAGRIHTMPKHSILGPSGAAGWMGCAGSVNAQKPYPREENIYAANGTAAHIVAEKCLKQGSDAEKFLGKKITVADWEFEVDREMVVGVQMYLDVVRKDAKEMKCKKIHIEKRLDMSRVHPDIFGTSDVVLHTKKLLKVFDLKYGRGVVEVRENPQPLLYGVGALLEFDKNKEVEEIEMIIVQPRTTNPIRRWTVTRKYMNDFAKVARAAALATDDPDAPRTPGEKQCQWCSHKPHCPEVEAFALEKAMAEFDDDDDLVVPEVEDMGDNTLAEVLHWSAFIKSYLNAVEAKALKMLERGEEVDGFKLVDKRPVRSWKDSDKAIKALKRTYGLRSEDLYHPGAMLSPPQMEKLLTKPQREKMNDKLVVKTSSGTKMVPEGDPATEVSAGIESDFADD